MANQVIQFRDGAEVKPENESVATRLIALALEQPDLFHDCMNDAYVTVASKDDMKRLRSVRAILSAY